MALMTRALHQLKERGLIQQLSSDELAEHLGQPRRFYLGIDPTAESLHIGNLVGLIIAKWLQQAGHTPVIITGGATAKIGDPSGKCDERPLLSFEQIEANSQALRTTCASILSSDGPQPIFLNNDSWIAPFSFIDFLRDVGKHFRLGPMLAKEMVKTRLASDAGLSFTEFSYQLLQGYDFAYLFDKENVTLQIGGSDQWGNITAGIDLGRKLKGAALYGLTHPLLLKSDGTKFGKSASGAVWLSKDKLSPYGLYQYLVRTEDSDVYRMLQMLTFLPLDEIKGLVTGDAQKRLAFEVTALVHGKNEATSAEKASALAAPGKTSALSKESLAALSGQIPTHKIAKEKILGNKVMDVLVEAGISESKGAVRRLIQNRGLYLNEAAIDDPNHLFEAQEILGSYVLVALGKKNKVLIELI